MTQRQFIGPIALTALLIVACDSVDSESPRLRSGNVTNADPSRDGDECAPGNAPDADDAPDAVCAEKFDAIVPDLIDGEDLAAAHAPTGTSGARPQNLRPLSGPGTDRPSCQGKTGPGITTCGPNENESCCRSLDVPGGKAGAIRVNTFDLGVYEVTVGRFEVFVETFGGNLRGAAESGAIPGISAEHAAKLPPNRAAVDLTMGDACVARSDVANYGARTWPSKKTVDIVNKLMSDDNDRAADIRADATPVRLRAKPVNCVNYWMAEAFCKWDGGRLPTNDEWKYAAIGGDELRSHPWSGPRTPDKLVTDFNRDQSSFTYPEDFPYFGNGMNAYHIAPPGQKPAGAARWGHMDMAGNVLEFMADITSPGKGILRGGSWEGHGDANSVANVNYPLGRTYGAAGFRCAYGEAPEPPPEPEVRPTVPVFRAYNAKKGDHLMGIVRDDIGPNYVDEGRQFFIFDVPPKNSAPLVRCAKDGFNYLANDPACNGNKSKGQIGFVSTTAFDGSWLLYRCRDPKGKDRISTTKPTECKKRGYDIEGTQGYVSVGNAVKQ